MRFSSSKISLKLTRLSTEWSCTFLFKYGFLDTLIVCYEIFAPIFMSISSRAEFSFIRLNDNTFEKNSHEVHSVAHQNLR